MTIELRKPDLERLIGEEIRRGHFEDVDELLTEALQALREKNISASKAIPRKNLAQFLLESPFAGSDLTLERVQDYWPCRPLRGWLLDTNILSEFSRSLIPPDPNVKLWVELADPEILFASVLSLGEIRKGTELLPVGKKWLDLEQWLELSLNTWFGKNLLTVTQAVSERWGVLAAKCQQKGRPLGNIDGLIAATALENGPALLLAIQGTLRDWVSMTKSAVDGVLSHRQLA